MGHEWKRALEAGIWVVRHGFDGFGAGCKALLQLVAMIPTFCYTYPGLEHMEELRIMINASNGKVRSEVFQAVCHWILLLAASLGLRMGHRMPPEAG